MVSDKIEGLEPGQIHEVDQVSFPPIFVFFLFNWLFVMWAGVDWWGDGRCGWMGRRAPSTAIPNHNHTLTNTTTPIKTQTGAPRGHARVHSGGAPLRGPGESAAAGGGAGQGRQGD